MKDIAANPLKTACSVEFVAIVQGSVITNVAQIPRPVCHRRAVQTTVCVGRIAALLTRAVFRANVAIAIRCAALNAARQPKPVSAKAVVPTFGFVVPTAVFRARVAWMANAAKTNWSAGATVVVLASSVSMKSVAISKIFVAMNAALCFIPV